MSSLRFASLLLLVATRTAAVTIAGQVVGESGEALRGSRVHLVQVSFDDCCHDQSRGLESDGTFRFDVPPAVYVLRADGLTPFYPRTIRIDARHGDQTAIRLQLTRQPRRYVPDDPPRAAKISVSTPDQRGQAILRGSAGAVAPSHFVILVNTDTGDVALTEAGADGSFEATLFAPAGTSVLIKSDPYGDAMRIVAAQGGHAGGGIQIPPFFLPLPTNDGNVDFNIGPLAPLPGTYIDVPLPPAEGGRIAIGASGGPFGSGTAGLPSWIVRGSMNRDRFNAGEMLEVTATISISSSQLSVDTIPASANLILERLTFADGRPALAHGVQVSTLLTPTGFGIMHAMRGSSRYQSGGQFEITRVAADRAEGTFSVLLTLPADLPAGYYRGVLSFFLNGYPVENPPSRPQLLLDSSNREGPTAISLPPIRVGAPAAPRLYWTLLTDTLTEGTRGAMPVEDELCCAVTAIVQVPSKYLVVPRVDERTQTPLVYRLEPFALMVSSGDRGLTPPPPAIRFRFPSGRLTARIERPDGVVETIGPAPFVQARVAGPLDRHGRVPDPGGLSLHDAYQLTTLDPRFEVTFASEGPYRITLDGEIEDLIGTTWIGRGTYQIQVGRKFLLDTATLPGTPFDVGNALTPSVTLVPPIPAQIEVRTQLDHGDVKVLDRTDTFAANRFGVGTGPAVRFDQPGEYRVDITASHRDAGGRWWFGSRTWGGVVATPNTPIITHGRRGIDDLPGDQRQAWFFRNQTTSKLGSGHVNLPFHSGDVTWNQELDALIPGVTFDDRDGSMFRLMGIPREGPAAIGEASYMLSARDGNDPHFDPSALDLWSYAYRSIQRPAVRIREQISDASLLPSLYWRFSDQYGQQSGNGRNGDRPNDFKFQFAATVFRGPAVAPPQYSIYGSLFVLVPDNDPGGGTRTFPPFQGNGSGSSGGPLFKLKGKEIDLFFHSTAVRPGTILVQGDVASFAGYSAPTLPSKITVDLTSPGGRVRTIKGQANRIGWFYEPGLDFTVDEPGVWKAKVKIVFDGVLPSTSGQVTAPFPAGDVLGSREGEFYFYVVRGGAAPLALASMPPFVRPADGPITFTIAPPSGLTDVSMTTTTTMPGFILEERTTSALTYTYDAQRLAQDFPNLDLNDADGVAGADIITISFLVSGTDAAGKRKHFARQVVIQGEELQMPEQKATPATPRRRAAR